MDKRIIVGGGFSAATAFMLLGDSAKVLTPVNQMQISSLLINRPKLDLNKLFSKKTKSIGSLKYESKNGRLHDRLSLGGNSSIWGGFFNAKDIPRILIKLFFQNGIKLVRLSKKKTGSFSSVSELYQLQNECGEIFNLGALIRNPIDGYLLSFSIDKNLISIEMLTGNEDVENDLSNITASKLVICVGVVQLIDLLYRSEFLHEGDSISLSEYRCKFKLRMGCIGNKKLEGDCKISFKLGRALCHVLGIQRYPGFIRAIDFLPIYVEQIFSSERVEYSLAIKEGSLVDALNRKKERKLNFGSSIHYCNMRVNGLDINIFLKGISSNIIGIGMPFINQSAPGPISNDILMDAYQKLRRFSL